MKNVLSISIFLLLFLFLWYFLWIQNISSKQKNNLDIIHTKQQQFNTLEDDVIFSQQEVKRYIMEFTETWRISIHNFPTLGIKVYSDDPYSESFKTKSPFIIKNGNMLIDKFSPIQYIEVIAKDPREDMENIYNKEYLKQFGTWCYTSIEIGNSGYFTGNSAHDIIIYNAIAISWGYTCYVGKPDTERYISIFYNKKIPDRYYVAHLSDACDPGKCNVFNQIELY